MKNKDKKTGIRKDFYPGDVPDKPGIYVFRDRFGEVIYVGKAASLRKRMSQYFQPSRWKTADPKLRSLLNSIDRWECYPLKNEDESLVLESRFIKEYAPKYNVLMRDDKRFLLIKINLHEKLPKLSLARVRKDDGFRYFGPFPKGTALRDTVLFLTRHFGLRACRPAIPDENDHKHCLASVVKDCCAPCIGKISEQDYRKRIVEMMRVLEGDTKELVGEVREKMEQAAKQKKFEKAAGFRDIIENIEITLGAKNRNFRFASIPSESGENAVFDLQKALGLPKPPKVIEGFDISNISGQLAVAAMVCFENGRPQRNRYRRFKIRDVKQMDDFAMMKEVIRRHYSRKIDEKRPMPDLILIDGGKGQLNASISALSEMGCAPLPVLGLAKKFEEIFIPGRKKPIVIDRQRAALKLLQALRDEAHRFAVNYHRELRAKRLQESLLDDIPGIGSARKKVLLETFGSVRELRKKTPEEISSKVPGIGIKFARIILDNLK